MKKTIIAALILGTALTAAASDSKKPSASQKVVVAQNPQTLVDTPFKVFPDGNWIFVVNYGTTDWTAALDVWAMCKPVAPTASCGPNFVGGKYLAGHYAKGAFPAGHGNAPIKGSANAQQVSGAGWVAVHMGLPAGSYKITAKAANDSSPETDITIAGQGGGTIQVQQGGIQLAPTKTPAPRRP